MPGKWYSAKNINDRSASMIDIVSSYVSKIYDSKNFRKYPSSLKTADVMPIYKERNRTWKENYRPVSILSTLSKIFEGNMNEQILTYIEKHLSQVTSLITVLLILLGGIYFNDMKI